MSFFHLQHPWILNRVKCFLLSCDDKGVVEVQIIRFLHMIQYGKEQYTNELEFGWTNCSHQFSDKV